MERRTFLKAGGIGGVGLAIGGLMYRVGGVWWDQEPGAALRVLSGEEAQIFGCIADTIFPGEPFAGGMPSATSVGIVGFFDRYLDSVDARTSQILRLLLHAIDEGAVVADWSGRRFRARPAHEREKILETWDTSWFSARRGAYTSIELLIAMGYTEHPDVLRAAGITFTCGRRPPEPEAAIQGAA